MLLSLDLSTSTGWAVFEGTNLVDHGVIIHKTPERQHHPNYPFNMIGVAKAIATDIVSKCKGAHMAIIEETNQGGVDRYAQKQIEFIHFAVASELKNANIAVHYISTAQWQSRLGIKFTKEHKAHNKLVKEKKAKGKITKKHLTVEFINNKYGLDLKMKDNDIADAIGVGAAFLNQEK